MEMISKPQTKVSSYRISGWLEVSTGIIHIFYGSEMPVQDGSFTKSWDCDVNETSVVTPHVGP